MDAKNVKPIHPLHPLIGFIVAVLAVAFFYFFRTSEYYIENEPLMDVMVYGFTALMLFVLNWCRYILYKKTK